MCAAIPILLFQSDTHDFLINSNWIEVQRTEPMYELNMGKKHVVHPRSNGGGAAAVAALNFIWNALMNKSTLRKKRRNIAHIVKLILSWAHQFHPVWNDIERWFWERNIHFSFKVFSNVKKRFECLHDTIAIK